MPQTWWCNCLPVYQISFFPPPFLTWCLSSFTNALSLCPGCEQGLVHLWVRRCRRFLPSTVPLLEGDKPLGPVSCLYDDHLYEVREKTGIAKPSNPECLFQHTGWNPWGAAVRSCSSGVGFGSPLAQGGHWWPPQAHRCPGALCVDCMSNYHLLWAELSCC